MTDITWTDAGRLHAAANNVTTEIVESLLRIDIARGDVHPDLVIGHVIEPADDVIFVVTRADERLPPGTLVIDGAEWQRTILDEGPFAGKVALVPRALSDA